MLELVALFLLLIAVFASPFATFLVLSYVTNWRNRTRDELLAALPIYDPSGVETDMFPSIATFTETNTLQCTEPSVYLSVVIPAMNEEDRLPEMLNECLPYLNARAASEDSFSFEVIIVDDGSVDSTAHIAYKYAIQYGSDTVRVLKLKKNVGKGGAVRHGVLRSRGSMILFVDADGASKFSDIEKLEHALWQVANNVDDPLADNRMSFAWSFPAIAIGSRAHMEYESRATRSFLRTFLMIGFHIIVYVFAVKTIRDTQCGFKLFTRAAAAKLFMILHIEKWAFDVEILHLAERFRYPVREIAISWHEVDGSKIAPVYSCFQMGRDLLLIWSRYYFRIWSTDIAQ